MSFSIDRQSLEELNLLGKFRAGSVYHLFNQVKTRGGEKLMDELFRHPLTDAAAINQRSAVFEFFQSLSIAFPFESEQVTLMQEYMDGASGRSLPVVYSSLLIQKTLSSLTRDERYKKLIQGLQATISVLKKCYALTELLHAPESPFQPRVDEVKKILSDERLMQVIETDIYRDISFNTIAGFDHLLRTKFHTAVTDLLLFIAEVDVNISVSNVARAKHFRYAKALPKESNLLEASNLRHPAVPGAIGNNLFMNKKENVIFLTGANMAGKSTWMKSIGIGMYMAHIGFPVAADSMTFSIREGIFSSINVADNIGLGYSHFYAEVVRVKTAADATATGKHLLLIFDELFKGTNVKDAYDGTLAVTEGFAEYGNCLFILSTHIIEVGEALQSHANIRFKFMPTIMDGVVPRYTYKLQDGITQDRQGMMIIRNEKILELLQG
jgi:DNA mismatch repair ATPase MutS